MCRHPLSVPNGAPGFVSRVFLDLSLSPSLKPETKARSGSEATGRSL